MRKFVTVSLINMPAMLNTINFMHLCYSLMPVLQWNSSIKVVFFSLSNPRCRLDLNWRGLASENKKYQASSKIKIKFKGPTFITSKGLTSSWDQIKSKGLTPLESSLESNALEGPWGGPGGVGALGIYLTHRATIKSSKCAAKIWGPTFNFTQKTKTYILHLRGWSS